MTAARSTTQWATHALTWATALLFACAGGAVRAAIVGPYVADANTIYLFHMDQPAGSSAATNSGSAGFAAVAYDGHPYAGDGVNQPGVTTVVGAAAGFAGFGSASDLSASTELGLGVDFNGDGAYLLDDGAPIGTDRQADHSALFGAGNVFTLEALVKLPTITSGNRQIISSDNAGAAADRGIQFRVTAAGSLEFNFIGVNTSAVSTPIPTTGDHAFVANEWFHAAMTYDGTNAQFYWTRVAPQVIAANPIGAPLAEAVDVADDLVLVIGNEGRVVGTNGSQEGLGGMIDEVRISNVVRGPSQFIFVPEPSGSLLAALAVVGAMAARRRRI